MILTTNNIKNMHPTEIYKHLPKDIMNVYLKFKFAGFTLEDYNKYLMQAINQSKITYKGNESYTKYIEHELAVIMSKEISHKLQTPDSAYELIKNYIEDKLIVDKDNKKNLKSLQKLDKFLLTYNYTPDIDMVTKLLQENKTLNALAKQVFEKHKSTVVSGMSYNNFNSFFISTVLETYCQMQGIEIENIEEESIFYDENIDNSLSMYLKEIQKYPLLTAEEEKELMTRVKQGDKKAKEEFINCNLRLVVSVAKKFNGFGIPLLDLIQEGNTGLMTAIDKYEISTGNKFSTYSYWWIKQAIRRALNTTKQMIRIPEHIWANVLKMSRVERELNKELNREPTPDEVMSRMDINEETYYKIKSSTAQIVSMDAPISDSEKGSYGNFIPAKTDIENEYAEKDLAHQLNAFLKQSGLSDIEIDIVVQHLGYNVTLQELGDKYGITRERVRQKCNKALKLLRKDSNLEKLLVYTQNPTKSKEFIDRSRNIPTLYSDFSNFTHGQISSALNRLDAKERKIVSSYYKDFENNPLEHNIPKKEVEYYELILKPVIIELLNHRGVHKENLSCYPYPSLEEYKPSDDRKDVSSIKQEPKDNPVPKKEEKPVLPRLSKEKLKTKDQSKLPNKDVSTIKKEYLSVEESNKDVSTIKKEDLLVEESNEDISTIQVEENDDDSSKTLNFLQSATTEDMLKKLSVQEMIIVSLRYGYINDRCFSTKEVSNFLGVNEEYVKEVTEKGLTIFEDKWNDFLDKAQTTKNNHQLIKRKNIAQKSSK